MSKLKHRTGFDIFRRTRSRGQCQHHPPKRKKLYHFADTPLYHCRRVRASHSCIEPCHDKALRKVLTTPTHGSLNHPVLFPTIQKNTALPFKYPLTLSRLVPRQERSCPSVFSSPTFRQHAKHSTWSCLTLAHART